MLRRRRLRDEARRILEDEFDRETLSTEKLRVSVLLVVIGAVAVLSLIPPTYLGSDIEHAFRGDMPSFVYWRFIVLIALVLYLFAELALLGHLAKRGRKVPTFHRYAAALIETSCPTAEIMVLAAYADAVAALSIPVLAYSIFIVLSALRLNFRLSVFTGAVAAGEYALVGMVYIDPSSGQTHSPLLTSGAIHLVKALFLLALGVVTGLVALQIKKRILNSFKLAEERNNVVDTFGQHVSPVVVDRLLERGTGLLPSEKRNVCVMFLDIRNFTAFAEKRRPEEVVDYLESLFEFMIEIVNRHHGIVNKFLGDGFMAVFGAPLSDGRDCSNAVAAAREILSRVEEEVAGGTILPTRVGIGLHAGEAVTGSIGSSLRKEYTVIGDVVNLASRIEQLNKQFGAQLLISEEVWEAALKDGLTGALPMGHVPVRGREAPIGIYRVA